MYPHTENWITLYLNSSEWVIMFSFIRILMVRLSPVLTFRHDLLNLPGLNLHLHVRTESTLPTLVSGKFLNLKKSLLNVDYLSTIQSLITEKFIVLRCSTLVPPTESSMLVAGMISCNMFRSMTDIYVLLF